MNARLPFLWKKLAGNGTMRFSESDKVIHEITQKMLSQQLKSPEEENIISRISYPVIPPKVEYSLTEKGSTLSELPEKIMKWSKTNLQEKIVADSITTSVFC